MSKNKTALRFILLCLIILVNHLIAISQQLTLKISGDKQAGYRVDNNNSVLLVTSTEEFPLQLHILESNMKKIKYSINLFNQSIYKTEL